MRPILVLLLVLAACGPAREEADRSRAGGAAPATAFEDPDGKPVNLARFRGRPLLLNLWATWCAPCIAEMPTLDSLAARERGRLHVLTVSQDLDGREKVESFFDKQGYRNLGTWLDPEMALMGELKADTLPVTILFDSEGREVWRVAGDEDWTSRRAARLIEEGLSPEAAR